MRRNQNVDVLRLLLTICIFEVQDNRFRKMKPMFPTIKLQILRILVNYC